MDGITIKPDGKGRLRVTFPFPATTITVAPHKPGKLAPDTNPTTSTPGKPLTTHPPHPFIKAVDDELVLRGEDSTDYLSERSAGRVFAAAKERAGIFKPPTLSCSKMGAFDSAMDLSLFVGTLIAVSVFKSTGQIAPVFLIAVLPAIFAFFATVAWLPRQVQAIGLAEPPGRS